MNRAYHCLFWSQACVELGEQLLIVALVWAALRSPGGGFVGVVLAAWALPRGVLLLVGGALSDRYDRRALSVGVGCGLTGVAGALAVVTRTDVRWAWLVAAALFGVLDAVRLPVAAGVLPSVVPRERLAEANRWVGMREWAALAAGPAAGGALVAAVGSSAAIAVVALLYALSVLVLVPVGPLPPAAPETAGLLAELRDGVRFVGGHRELRTLLAMFAVANLFVLGLLGVTVPVFATTVLHGGPATLGLLSASFGTGLVLGTLASTRLPEALRTPAATMTLFAASDALLASVGHAATALTAAVLYGASGFAAGPASTFYRTLLQTLPPAAYLGRVSGIARTLSFGLEPLSAAGAGALTARASASVVLVVGGAVATLADLTGAVVTRVGTSGPRARDDVPGRRAPGRAS
ncbi:MFS transporter [Cryptosporangium phraense]|uniref:MFS transporter n=1 Tax=Cryptosporangium phraense TaxID=2593070 RepID=UPI00147886A0|nr:MFS transporter [Cryptosporangium phraense]